MQDGEDVPMSAPAKLPAWYDGNEGRCVSLEASSALPQSCRSQSTAISFNSSSSSTSTVDKTWGNAPVDALARPSGICTLVESFIGSSVTEELVMGLALEASQGSRGRINIEFVDMLASKVGRHRGSKHSSSVKSPSQLFGDRSLVQVRGDPLTENFKQGTCAEVRILCLQCLHGW